MLLSAQGYDISNYRQIAPEYGSIEDVDVLKDKLHERGMKLVLDLVMNHTSDQHEWFKQSRSSKDNKYRDWYIWKKPKFDARGNRQPPNNWQSHFQGMFGSHQVQPTWQSLSLTSVPDPRPPRNRQRMGVRRSHWGVLSPPLL